MSKLSQLQQFKAWQIPTPPFTEVSYEDFQVGQPVVSDLTYPLAVRSTFQGEDGERESYAGHFHTELYVWRDQLSEAISLVFDSYPEVRQQSVILQEMIVPEFSGVLFAFREGVWKLELTPGHPEQVVGGQCDPQTILLPRFSTADVWFSSVWKFWKAYSASPSKLDRALILLSRYAGLLLNKMEARHGLDIEFAIVGHEVYLLQARPVTTPEEAETVLTAANHKEILPPHPSQMMTALISDAGQRLFDFYRSLDPTLPNYAFVEEAAGMPWINLSALLDVMVHWGLPTKLVSHSVGAEDFYGVGFRPWRAMNKLPIFLRLYHRQRRAIEDVRKWLTQSKGRLKWQRAEREIFWQNQPEEAFQLWQQHFQALYLSLVNYMQLLTGAMSGPVNILDRLNLLTKLSGALKEKSASTNYLSAFNDLKGGHISRDVFLRQFGHRGFYESDLGQARFGDFDDEDWWQLLGRSDQQAGVPEMPLNKPLQTPKSAWPWVLGRVIRLIHMREELRHETMKFFWPFRQELQEHSKYHLGPDIDCWQYRPQDLSKLFAGELLPADPTPGSSGWDMDTFLHNRLGRRLPIDLFMGHKEALPAHAGIGIYPGQVSGQVWRVAQAGLSQLHRPDFQSIILVADALDPGWIPFFTGVDGVISYTGGLLSHASIILRESGIPAITQLPAHLELQTGDWIEMDGQTGEVKVFSRENDPVNQL